MWLLLACAHAPIAQTGGPETPTVAPAPAGELAPNPFTAEQLRNAFPVGTHIRFRIRSAGEPDVEERWTITAADASGMTIASQIFAADGTLVEDQGSGTSTWEEFHHHADFPASQTVREESSVDVPAGHFDTWLYTVVDPASDTVKRYHFSKTLPGPPVFFSIQKGKGTVFEMILLERT